MIDLNTNNPYTYKEWVYRQNIDISDTDHPKYVEYLKSWYANKKLIYPETKKTIKDEYVQLLKDLSFLFSESEENRFLRDVDFENKDEVIYAIPFFAKKLKEISKVLINKRESTKNAKLKYNMVGSNKGLETLLYDYVLRSFTKKDGNITQIPASELLNILPQLSAVKNDFYIEVEELHDPTLYQDSDPTIDIGVYQKISEVLGEIPLETLTVDELSKVLASRLIPRLANSNLSKLIGKYIESDIKNSTNVSQLLVETSKRYLGEPIYGLTAVRLSETNNFDMGLDIDLTVGNNWFLWPSGNIITNDYTFSNVYAPIKINDSLFFASSAKAGTTYEESDLIFTEKNGSVEGAWLLSDQLDDVSDVMSITIMGGESKEFRFPFAGFKLKTKGSSWDGFSINDSFLPDFYDLDNSQREQILTTYFTETIPQSASTDITLNRTSLVDMGAFAGNLYTNSDTIVKKSSASQTSPVYSEDLLGPIESAFLYKPLKTDLPISVGISYVYWPYMVYVPDEEFPITIKDDVCAPINLNEVDSRSSIGAVAGLSFNDSDVIYKLNSRTLEPMEAAFLQTSLTDELDLTIDNIAVYENEAVRCSKYISGPIQGALSLKINPLEKVSFIWTDVDTYADDVFKFYKHSDDCPYGKISNDYYTDQSFINLKKSLAKNNYKNCSCKSVYFSPIGHEGESIFEYNGMADILFHDPDGVGEDFALNSWKDTRNLTVKNSPQFSFYKITSGDSKVGWGDGFWKTGNGQRMVLKTGKRYTYYRSSQRRDNTTDDPAPYFVVKYPYKKIVGLCYPGKSDIVILWDISKTQENVFGNAKDVVKLLAKKLIAYSVGSTTKVSIIAFDNDTIVVGYLSKDSDVLNFYINQVSIKSIYPDYATNIKGALEMAYYILTTPIPTGSDEYADFSKLCKSLASTIINSGSSAKSFNVPRPDASKKILIISDGSDSYEPSGVIEYANFVKSMGVEIHSVDFGELANLNNLMEEISTDSIQTYFNLQRYMIYGDGDINSFVEHISRKINGCRPISPRWMKAVRDANGNWSGNGEVSDLIIRAGDFLSYVHQDVVTYRGFDSYSDFTNIAINFTTNFKLDGWDYTTNTFSLTSIGLNFGAKPFWGEAYSDKTIENRFNKETNIFGGHIRYFEEYTPITQPNVSPMILENDSLITYNRKDLYKFSWDQPLDFVITTKVNRWKKLEFITNTSNLSEILKNGTIDRVSIPTFEDSDLVLEGYSQFKPAKYNYYARKPFKYSQPLYYSNRDVNSFVTFLTGYYIDPTNPYNNLTNVHFPTIAIEEFPKNCITEKSVGHYLLPENLGTSHYLGRGYTYKITSSQLTIVDGLSAERLYYDLNKYGNRNRGLTKNDQVTISELDELDNRWISESYFNNNRAGIIKNPQRIQKLLPYQTDYENKGKNYFGLSRQGDDLQLWHPADPAKWNDPSYNLTLRNELTVEVLLEKIKTFLVNRGVLVQWKSDIYGNEFGVYKGDNIDDTNFIKTEEMLNLLTELLEYMTIE